MSQDFASSSRGQVPAGTRLNGIYEIDSLLAVGGMGEVYRGRAIQTDDRVAIKVIKAELAENEAALALFRKEASALHNLHHEAIVRYFVFSLDPTLQRHYLAMELVEGLSLSDLIKRGPLSVEDAHALQKRIAQGLQAAHERGIVHRDISPDNIIVQDGRIDQARIIDFGIARSTRAGDGTVIGGGFAGKYNYVSPEQLGLFNGDVTGKSDIYSLGLVLAQALRGQAIDMGGSQFEVVDKRRRVPDVADLDARIRPMIERMLAPDPAQRPANMAEVAAFALAPAGRAGRGRTATVPPRGDPKPQPRKLERNPNEDHSLRNIVFALFALALVGVGGFAAWLNYDAIAPLIGIEKKNDNKPPPKTEIALVTTKPAPEPAKTETPPAAADPAASAPTGPAPSYTADDVIKRLQPKPAEPQVALLPPEPPPAAKPPEPTLPVELLKPAKIEAKPPEPAPPVEPLKPAKVEVKPPEPAPPVEPLKPAKVEAKPPEPAPPVEPLKPAKAEVKPPEPAKPKDDPQVAILTPPPPLKPGPETPDRRLQVIRDYDGGECFLALPRVLTAQATEIEGYGSDIKAFEKFDAALTAKNIDAQIDVRQIQPAQCAAIRFIARLKHEPRDVPKLDIARDHVPNGQNLEGRLAAAQPHLALLIVDEEGNVGDATPLLKAGGDGFGFKIPLVLEHPPTNGAQPELLIAIASPQPIPALKALGDIKAEKLFPELLAQVKKLPAGTGVAARYFKVE